MSRRILRTIKTAPMAVSSAQERRPQAAKPKPQRVVIPPMVDAKYGSPAQIMALPPARLIAILEDRGASVYAKAKACQQLAIVGDKAAVPALAALLTDPRLSHYARFGLEPIPDPSVDEALRAALAKVKGRPLVGVINSIGRRKDTKALDALAKLRHNTDSEVAQAAEAALARIRPPL
jgi:HEAT repeat protein